MRRTAAAPSLCAIAAMLLSVGPARGEDPGAEQGRAVLLGDNAAAVVAEGSGADRNAAVAGAVDEAMRALVRRLSDPTKPARVDADAPLPLRAAHEAIQGQANVLELPRPEGDKTVRVRITAKVASGELAASLRNPEEERARPGDGARIANAIKAKNERAAEIDAWVRLAFEGYPFGAVRVELLDFQEVANRRNDSGAVFRARVRHAIDPRRYAEVAAWTIRAAEAIAVAPTVPFGLTFDRNASRRDPDTFILRPPPRGYPRYHEFVQPNRDAAHGHVILAVAESVQGVGPLAVSGRVVTIESAAAPAIHATIDARSKLQAWLFFPPSSEGEGVSRQVTDGRVGVATQAQLPYRDDRGRFGNGPGHLFVVLPTVRQWLYAPSTEWTTEFGLRVNELSRVVLRPTVGFGRRGN